MKIAFFWTWEFSKNIWERLIEDYSHEIEIKLMVSQPDKPVGRKKIMTKTPVKVLAEENNIEILQPTRLKPHPNPPLIKGGDRTKEFYEILESLELDFIVVVAYWKIIPKEILEAPKYGCINIHGSVLPLYRWASPIQESIKNGDEETGITIMYMSEWMDEWDILSIEKVDIKSHDKTEGIFKKFEKIWPNLLVDTLKKIINWDIKWKKQDDTQATYCSKINKTDGEINFVSQTAQEIYNKYRAYSPWPWIYTYYNGKKISIEDCEVLILWWEKNKSWEVITLEDKKIWVICSEWIVILKQIKLEWKKSMDILSFINGNKDFLDYNF